MGRTKPQPTDAELAILRVLWRDGPSTVRAVHEALPEMGGYTSKLKLLQIMAEKALVNRDESQRSHVYRARVTRDATERRLVGTLMDKLFDGSSSQLVLRALSSRPTSRAEIEEIRAMLDRLDPLEDEEPTS